MLSTVTRQGIFACGVLCTVVAYPVGRLGFNVGFTEGLGLAGGCVDKRFLHDLLVQWAWV